MSEKMELKDFIKGVVSDVVNSIIELNDELKGTDAIVSPRGVAYNGQQDKGVCVTRNNGSNAVHQIFFNVLVESSKEREKSGGVSIKVLGGSIENTDQYKQGTEIKFSIPVMYPLFDIKIV